MAIITEPLVTSSVQTADAVAQSISVTAFDSVETADALSNSLGASALDQVAPVDTATSSAATTESLLSDTLQPVDSVIDGFTENITDSVQTADAIIGRPTVNQVLRDRVETVDSSLPLWIDYVTDAVQTRDSSVAVALEEVIDQVVTVDSFAAWTYTEQIIDQLFVADNLNDGTRNEFISDSVQTRDFITEGLGITESLVDSLVSQDSVIQSARAVEQVADSVIVSDTAASAPSIIIQVVTDSVEVVDRIYSADPNAIAWVLNTETGAAYYFTNYGFTDLVEHSGMLFAAAPDGLYLLEGDDDAGTDIEASLTTGFLELNTPYKKRLPDIYFGYTGGELECDIETYDQPNDIFTYGMDARDADAPRNNRIQLGKGLESRYWRFTLRNIAGSAFQVYDTIANVVSSKRRL